MSKRFTPDGDYQRLAENLYLKKGRFIETKEDFQKQFQDYMQGTGQENDYDLMDKTEKFYTMKRHFKETNPRQKTRITKQQARHFPKFAKQVRANPAKSDFKYLRQVKGRTVYAREIQTKTGLRFIDKKGHYTGVRK